jgi:hypothetical protein
MKFLTPLQLSHLFILGLIGLAGCTGVAPSSPTAVPSPMSPTPFQSPQKSPQTKALETKLKADLAKRAGIKVQTVTCPEQVTIQAGSSLNCRATAEGQTFTIAISPKGNKSELQWNTQGLLVLPKLEQTIQKGIKDQFKVAVKTSCGGTLRAAKPGDTFVCKIIDSRGQARPVTVRVDDDRGNVTWKL